MSATFKSFKIILLMYFFFLNSAYAGAQNLTTDKNRSKPFNGSCDRAYVEKKFGFKDNGYGNFNKNIKEPIYIKDCPLPHKNLKDAYQVTFGHVVINNSQYFRWKKFESSENYNSSYLILGDSMSWGVGMPVNSTYPFLLQEYLKNKNDIVNSLVLPGAPLDTHYINLKQYIKLIKPTHIILALYHNDIESTKKPLNDFTKNKLTKFLDKIYLKNISKLISKFLDSFNDWVSHQDRAFKDKSSFHWKNFETNLKLIKKLSQDFNVNAPIIMFVNGPYERNVIDFNNPPKEYITWLSWYDEMKIEACNQGYYVFDNFNSIKEKLNNKFLAINEWDYHPNEELHQLYFENLVVNINKYNNLEKKKNFC